MPKSEGRPAREHERPAFGSVWTWGPPEKSGTHYIVLGVEARSDRMCLLAVTPDGDVTDTASPMIWGVLTGAGLEVLPQWRCVDEGPAVAAMPDRSFPVIDAATLHAAVTAAKRIGAPQPVRDHIDARARSLGLPGPTW